MAEVTETGVPPDTLTGDHFRRMLAENIQEIFWILDPETYRVLYVNPAFERVTGIPVEDVYANATAWRSALDPRDRTRVESEIEDRNRLGEPHDIEGRLIGPDGEVRWMWARGLPVRDDGGKVIIAGVVEDITERKLAQERLDHSASLLRATLRATADGILAVDGEGQVAIINDRFVELWRLPRSVAEEAVGEEALWKHLLGQLREPVEFRKRLLEIGLRPNAESFDIVECLDGRIFEAYTRPRRMGGRINGRVWSFRDTTARARAERELRNRTRRLGLYNSALLHLARRGVPGRAEALERITEAASEILETERAGVWLYDSAHENLRLYNLYLRSEERHVSGDVLRREDARPYFGALEEERALAIHDVHSDPRTTGLADYYCAPIGIASMLDAPIRLGGKVVGVICFEQVGPPREWTVEDESFAGSIADLVSIAFEASDRERAEWGTRFLARASAILSSSIDYPATIGNVAHLAVPMLADWCLVDMVEDGRIRRIASSHDDPRKEELLRDLESQFPPEWDSPQPGARAIRTGKAEMVREGGGEILASRTRGEQHRRLIRQLELRSWIAVPMRRNDRTLGAITFVSVKRSYDGHDLALVTDLADRAAMAIENATLYERARESSRAKSDFLSVMSHELRTPLTAIQGYTDLILSGASGEVSKDQARQLERVRLRSKDLLRMIDEILDYARMEDGHDEPEDEVIDLAGLLREFAAGAAPLIEEAGLEFRTRIPEEPVPLTTDPARIEHILMNLVSNAVRYTERGLVTVEAQRDDGRIRIRVTDTGIGIDPGDQERIFEPFVQVEEVMTRREDGSGLGLSIARRFARTLGGDVTVESEPGKGSTFTLELPADK